MLGVGADQLVVAGEGRAEVSDIAAVAELAAPEAARGGAEAARGEHRMFRPDARVDDADDDVAAGIGRAAERRPDGRRADERGVVVVRLLERVLLDRDDAVDLEQVADLVRRDLPRDAAVGRAEGRADLELRRGLLGTSRDLLGQRCRVVVVRLDGRCVGLERLAGHARARGGEAVDAAGVGRRCVEVVLDHDVDERRVRASEERRVGLWAIAPETGLGPAEGRVRGQWGGRELRWVGAGDRSGEDGLPCQQTKRGDGGRDPSHGLSLLQPGRSGPTARWALRAAAGMG